MRGLWRSGAEEEELPDMGEGPWTGVWAGRWSTVMIVLIEIFGLISEVLEGRERLPK
jgi:hypothetical protein